MFGFSLKALRTVSFGLLGLLAPACGPAANEAPVADRNEIVARDAPGLCDPEGPRSEPLELFIQPEAGSAPFVRAIERATTSIDVMVYQIGNGPILDGLLAQARRGVKVRVILDAAQQDTNQRYLNRLRDAGADAIWSDPRFVFMHAKVLIVDRAEAIVSTGNYGEYFILRQRDFAVQDRDPSDVAILGRIFESDFAHAAEPDLACTRLLVAPTNARERLLALIAAARESLVIESMQLSDREIQRAILARKAAGVDVRIVLADPSWIDANGPVGGFFKGRGVPIRWVPNLHVKAIVVDRRAAYVGSVNMSWNSIDRNREVGLLVTEEANLAAARSTFEADWATATPF